MPKFTDCFKFLKMPVFYRLTFLCGLIFIQGQFVLAGAGVPEMVDDLVVCNTNMTNAVKGLTTVVKSQSADTFKHRKAFMKSAKPHLKALEKNLKTSEKLFGKIDKLLEKNGTEAAKPHEACRKLLHVIRENHDKSVNLIPNIKDEGFLKQLISAGKSFTTLSEKLLEIKNALTQYRNGLQSQLNVPDENYIG